jgi:hypothetical protein
LVDGEFLTNDGAIMEWAAISQLPDPTGSAGKVLGTDGSSWFPQSLPTAATIPTLPTTGVSNVSSTCVRIGTCVIQTGTGTLPASGTTTPSVAITFGTAMASCSAVIVNMTQHLTDAGYQHNMIPEVTNITGTGCTVGGCNNIFPGLAGSTVTFTYIAFGIAA